LVPKGGVGRGERGREEEGREKEGKRGGGRGNILLHNCRLALVEKGGVCVQLVWMRDEEDASACVLACMVG